MEGEAGDNILMAAKVTELRADNERLTGRIKELEGALERVGCLQMLDGAKFMCREIKGLPRSGYCFICAALTEGEK